MNLANISFPVYKLGHTKPELESGILFYYRDGVLKIVDDTNVQEPTLAERRLEVIRQGGTLYNISSAVFFLGDLIKLAKPTLWFIDSNGSLFQYKKSIAMKLIFKKIIKVLATNSGYILELDGIETRFKCLYAPKDKKYAGILKLGHTSILYGVYDEPYKETRRKI